MKEFIDSIKIDWTKIEYVKIVDWKVKVIDENEAFINKTKNIYFLNWVREDLVYENWIRAKDIDIALKNMFCIDIDMRNNFTAAWLEISDEEIIQEWITMIESLKDMNEYFWEWRYIVYSWNWLHIYYVSNPQKISKEEYSMRVERIYRQWDKLIWNEVFKSDHACKNIARILRLPWTVNQKNWATVKILREQNINSRLVDLLHDLYLAEKAEQDIINEQRQKDIKEKLQKFNDTDNHFYEQINSEIPAWQIAELLVPEFPFDWNKNFKNKKWWFTWYFYNKDDNTIVNWWSRYFAWWSDTSWWNNFSMIKRTKWFTDKETFAFFKEILQINN